MIKKVKKIPKILGEISINNTVSKLHQRWLSLWRTLKNLASGSLILINLESDIGLRGSEKALHVRNCKLQLKNAERNILKENSEAWLNEPTIKPKVKRVKQTLTDRWAEEIGGKKATAMTPKRRPGERTQLLGWRLLKLIQSSRLAREFKRERELKKRNWLMMESLKDGAIKEDEEGTALRMTGSCQRGKVL